MDQNIDKKIYKVGWEVIDSSNIKNLNLLRQDIYKAIKKALLELI